MVTEEDLMNELNRIRRQKREEAEAEGRKKVREYDEWKKRVCEEERSKSYDNKVETIKGIRERTDRKLQETDKLIERESVESEEQIRNMEKTMKAKFEEESDEVKEVMSQKVNELKQQNEKIVKNITKTNIELQETVNKRQETELMENEKTKQLRSEIASKTLEKKEENFQEVLKITKENFEVEWENERINLDKQFNNLKNEKQNEQKLIAQKTTADIDIFRTKLSQIKRENIKSLNRDIGSLHTIKQDVQESANLCLNYLMSKCESNSNFKRAEKQFDNLDLQLHKLGGHLLKMERILTEVPMKNRQKELRDKIRKVKGAQREFKSYLVEFFGRLMGKVSSWNDEMIEQFKLLQKQFSDEIDSIQALDSSDDIITSQLVHQVHNMVSFSPEFEALKEN